MTRSDLHTLAALIDRLVAARDEPNADLIKAINHQTDAIIEQTKAYNESSEPQPTREPQRIGVEVDFSPREKQRSKADYKNAQRLQWATFWVGFVTLIVLGVYTNYTRKQWEAILESNRITKTSADAAKNAAEIAAMQFEAAERPHVSGEFSFNKPLVIDKNGLHVNFTMTFTNTGATNAVNAFAQSNIFPLQPSGLDPHAERDRLCKNARESTSRFRFPIYAKQKGGMGFDMPINRSDLDSAARRLGGAVVPAIVVCIAYQPSFNAKTFYHTGFIYQITYIPDPESPNRMVIPVKDSVIPFERLDIHSTNGKPEISPD
jgi:hypothetical protein